MVRNGAADAAMEVVDLEADVDDDALVIEALLEKMVSVVAERLHSTLLADWNFADADFGPFRSTKNEDDESVVNERFITIGSSDEDSEEEFNRIMDATRRSVWGKEETAEEDDGEDGGTFAGRRTDSRLVVREYDGLPAIELLTIHVDEDIPLEAVGSVTSIVDCLVVVQCDSNLALDFETVLFDSDRNAVGEIFDVFGTVKRPMYAIRFNSAEEASAVGIGKKLYYAPDAQLLTKTVFTDQLSRVKYWDSNWDGDGECPEDQVVFSDDEEEKRYLAKHRHRKYAHVIEEGEEGVKKAREEPLERPLGERGRAWFGGRGRGRHGWARGASAGEANPSTRFPGRSVASDVPPPPPAWPNVSWPPRAAPRFQGDYWNRQLPRGFFNTGQSQRFRGGRFANSTQNPRFPVDGRSGFHPRGHNADSAPRGFGPPRGGLWSCSHLQRERPAHGQRGGRAKEKPIFVDTRLVEQ